MMMPFIVKALLEKHRSARAPFRLYEQRDRLVAKLRAAVHENGDWLMESLRYPLATA